MLQYWTGQLRRGLLQLFVFWWNLIFPKTQNRLCCFQSCWFPDIHSELKQTNRRTPINKMNPFVLEHMDRIPSYDFALFFDTYLLQDKLNSLWKNSKYSLSPNKLMPGFSVCTRNVTKSSQHEQPVTFFTYHNPPYPTEKNEMKVILPSLKVIQTTLPNSYVKPYLLIMVAHTYVHTYH